MFIQMNKLNKAGVSLVEMLIVIAIIGILLAVAGINLFGARQNMAVRSGGEVLQGDIVFAKTNALATNRQHRITVPNGGSTYSVEREDAPGVWTVVIAGQLEPGTSFTAVTGSNPIIWSTRGMPVPIGEGTYTIRNDRGSTGVVTYSTIGRVYVVYTMI